MIIHGWKFEKKKKVDCSRKDQVKKKSKKKMVLKKSEKKREKKWKCNLSFNV